MKKISYLVVALILMCITFNVKALTDADCITAEGSQTCTLSSDLEVTEQLVVQGQIVLDLNGHTISIPDSVLINSGVIGVKRGASLTINDSVGTGKISSGNQTYAAVAVTVKNEAATGSTATLIVNGGTLEGHYYGVVGNGNRHNTSITINGGSVIGLEGTGIYHPQEGTLIINDGKITGETGIEMRSGELVVNGGTITGTASFNVEPNGNGTTTTGVGIAIAQHTTQKDIDVRINGGEIEGEYALYESNPQGNASASSQTELAILGGTFATTNSENPAVYSVGKTGFIIGGTFNTALASDYISADSNLVASNGVYTVGSNDIGSSIDTEYASAQYASVDTYDVNITWDDLHWVFVYEGNIASPDRKVWVTKEYYDTTSDQKSYLNANGINGYILENAANLTAPVLGIVVENNSDFAVDVQAAIENITGNDKYTNAAGLQLSTDSSTFATTASILDIANGADANILVKPTAESFVNTTGDTASVTGEVTISISKTA